MRDKLEKRNQERGRYKGTFQKYGLKASYKNRGLPIETVLLVDVQTIQGEAITDHLWFNLTKSFKKLGDLYPNDIIAFDGRVRSYVKGYKSRREDYRETDYKLSHPTKIRFHEKAERIENYYLKCICGYHNIDDEPEKTLFRCRRCGMLLRGQELPFPIYKPQKIEQAVEQITLLHNRKNVINGN